MADNLTLNAGSGGAKLLTDEIPVTLEHKQLIGIVDATADSTNRAVVDGSGNLQVKQTANMTVVGAAADGAAASGNPVLIAGFDGTNAQSIATTAGGLVQIQVPDASDVTFGAKADAKSTATDTTAVTAMSVWKQISASVQAIATSVAGTLTVASHNVTNAGTFAVQDAANGTLIGAVTEAAPASDTASSGLNGRLQRIAQRLTSIIALLPAALGAGGGLKIDGSGTALPVSLASAPSTAVTNAGTFAVQASEADGANVTLGAKADAKSTATDTTSITAMSVWKQISASVQAIATSVSGTLTVASHAVTNAGTFAVQVTSAPSTAVTNAGTFAVQAVDAGDVASDGVDSGNPVKIGAQARTSDVTAVASADRVNAIATILGKLIVKLDAVPDLTWNYAAVAGGLVTTGGVTAKAAGAAGVRNYVKSVDVVNSHATISTEVVIRDGASGTVLHRGWAQAAGGGYARVFDPPLRGTAATLIEIAEVTTTPATGVLVNLQGYQAAE